jgi:hypothetical protein
MKIDLIYSDSDIAQSRRVRHKDSSIAILGLVCINPSTNPPHLITDLSVPGREVFYFISGTYRNKRNVQLISNGKKCWKCRSAYKIGIPMEEARRLLPYSDAWGVQEELKMSHCIHMAIKRFHQMEDGENGN